MESLLGAAQGTRRENIRATFSAAARVGKPGCSSSSMCIRTMLSSHDTAAQLRDPAAAE